MTAQNFLKDALRKWNETFEGIKIKYAYDAATEYHIVEVEPEKVRRGSSEYKKAEMKLWMDFVSNFPEENLLITSPSEANDMSNVLYDNRNVEELTFITFSESFSVEDLLVPDFSFGRSLDDVIPYIETYSHALAA